MKKKNQTICQFFDQNVMKKMSKNSFECLTFQENATKAFMKSQVTQALTPFSFLEFAGIQSKDILNLIYKGKPLNEYLCKYEELRDITSFLRKEIKEKMTKDFLKKTLLEEKNKESNHLSELGLDYINSYNKYFIEEDDGYKNLTTNLYLDSLSQINISGFSQEEQNDFNRHIYNPLVLNSICNIKRTMGGLKIMKNSLIHTCQEVKKQVPEDIVLNQNRRRVHKILEDLHIKPYSDLVDCELIHLACFGYYGNHCQCYTTDNPDIIKKRLVFYCEGILFIEKWFYEFLPTNRPEWRDYCNRYLPKERPKWRCGRVFILDEKTGEKIQTIPVNKIYEEIKKRKEASV